MSQSSQVNSNQINYNYYDIPKGTPSKEVRVVLAVLAAALLGGAIFMWAAYAKGMFHFDSSFKMGEIIAAAVATIGALAAFQNTLIYAFDRGAERMSGREEIELSVIDDIKESSLQHVRYCLCRLISKKEGFDGHSFKESYERNVNLGPHVRAGKLTPEQLNNLDAMLVEYNKVLKDLEEVNEMGSVRDDRNYLTPV